MIEEGKAVCDQCGKEFAPQPTEAEKEERVRKREEEVRAGRAYVEICAECSIPGLFS
jgi:hypothetical protein